MGRPEKQEQRVIAAERIRTLFGEASRAFSAGRRDRADRYVALAWKLHTRYKVPIPLQLKRRFCRRCRTYWVPGATVRVRIRNGRKVYACLACQALKRVPLKQ
jgi:ribonuclease P protein subunit RPR2